MILCFPLALAACGGGETSTTPVARGQTLYTEKSCVSCHSVDGSASVGPTWQGLYLSQVKLSDGSVVAADEPYLRESISEPGAKTVDGYGAGVMETVIQPGSLSAEEVTGLVEYIKSLK